MPTKRKPARKQPAAKPTTKKKAVAKKKVVAKKKPAAKKKPTAKKKPAPKKKPAAKKKPAVKKQPVSIVWSTPAELATAWNTAGRAYHEQLNALLVRLYAGEGVAIEIQDPRTPADGDAVVAQVIALNADGRGTEARGVYDPAYAPVFEWVKETEGQLGFVTIMGPDEVLVYHGVPWKKDGIAYQCSGGKVTPLPSIIGMTRSRNRDHLVVARETGLAFYDAREGTAALWRAPLAELPWPALSIFMPAGLPDEERAAWSLDSNTRFDLESLQVSDDGTRLVATFYRQGILLGSRRPGQPAWTLLLPGAGVAHVGDMTHAAISRDGARLAFGSQDTVHHTAVITETGAPREYAAIGTASEYPHAACFSDDGRYVAFNSCHFYNGATVAFDWTAERSADAASYGEHPESPGIDRNLRVYAACWLPADVVAAITGAPATEGAFALAGSGILRITTPSGKLLVVQGFGSSASSIDYDPESRRLALGSYSGMVHLYDPFEDEASGRIDGVKPRREVARWCFWNRLPHGPIRW